jgi:hypothetical protein
MARGAAPVSAALLAMDSARIRELLQSRRHHDTKTDVVVPVRRIVPVALG